MKYPLTPEGRYFIVRGRLWRSSNPGLSESRRDELTRALMRERSGIGQALRKKDKDAEQAARHRLHELKVALGERGAVWWTDGAPDYNRHLARNTPYEEWYDALPEDAR